MTGARDRSTLTLDGIGRRRLWPSRPGWYTEADFCVDPRLGLAVVARGIGAIGGQGKPAGKLAVWSLAGEVAAPGPASDSALARVQRGMARARVAVERLSANWPPGLGRPLATMAALLLDGPTAILAHIGDCRVLRIRPEGMEALTTEHTLATMFPAESIPPGLAGVLTRGLGGGGEPEIQRIDVQPGDAFLLTASPVGATFSPSELAAMLRPALSPGCDVAGVLDALIGRIVERTPDCGTATLALVKVGDRRGSAATRGSHRAPGPRWLYAPGQPLADPPEEWAAGTPGRGPDPRWFDEVFGGVMRDD